eukprot:403374380
MSTTNTQPQKQSPTNINQTAQLAQEAYGATNTNNQTVQKSDPTQIYTGTQSSTVINGSGGVYGTVNIKQNSNGAHQRSSSIKQNRQQQSSITQLQPLSNTGSFIQTIPENSNGQMSVSVEKGQLLKVKQTRQVMEKDEKLLENRIKMLENEESKLLKKIDQTRKQADKILQIKQQNEEQHRQKIQMQMQQDQNIDQFKEQKRQEKEQSKQKFMEYAKNVYEDKRNSYITLKHNRIQGEQLKNQYLQTVIQQNQDRKIQIRQQEVQAREKLSHFWNSKVERSQLNYLEKLDKQKQILHQKAQSISKMEEKEAELLRRLQNTQMRHKETFSMLENAMKGQSIGVKQRLTQSVDSRAANGDVNGDATGQNTTSSLANKKRYL